MRNWTLKIAAVLLVASLASPIVSAQSSQAPRDVDAVFDALRQMKGFEARFVEHKSLALLKVPLKSEGKLYYLSPGRLVRDVVSPEKMVISVYKGVVTIRDADGEKKMDLSSRPGVAAFVESFAHFLDGDRIGLSRHFHLKYSVDKSREANWQIELTPKEAPLNQVVRSIVMTGHDLTIQKLVVLETNGDKTVTELSQVKTGRQFTLAEKKRIFGI